jgi:hypothetical protein
MIDLEFATLDDIVAELRRREMHFALYVNLLPQYRAHGDIPSEQRQGVFGCTFNEKNPAFLASEFCNGIQRALDKVEDSDAIALSVDLSEEMRAVKRKMWQLARLTDPTLPGEG